VRHRLTYANVVASLALFIALGGVSVAATQLAANSVGTTQLKANAVTGAKVKNGSLTASDLTEAARATLKGETGATGPAGAAGAAGTSAAYATPASAPSVAFATTAGTSVSVAQLSVPAGSYAVVARVVANNGTKARKAVRCKLVTGETTVDDTDVNVYLAANGTANRAALPLAGAVTLTEAGTLDLVCTATATTGRYYAPSIVATQVTSVGDAASDDTGDDGTDTTTTTTTTTTETTPVVAPE
jgi:hypothetical protein